MRACRQCGIVKPIDGFYKSQKLDCKDCVTSRVRKHRRDNESVREYDRARAKQPHRKAHVAATTKKWRADNPEKYKAQTAVGNALRDGKLAKEPCYFCGTAENLHAHHRDYSAPLDVTWLCAKCHHRHHALGEVA